MRFRQLLPDSASVHASDLLAGLRLGSRAPSGRPYTAANFAASADRHATFAGALAQAGRRRRSRDLSRSRLREQLDAVLAGTETLHTDSLTK